MAVLFYLKKRRYYIIATSVYRIRIDSRVRKMIKELSGYGCQDAIRALIEDTVRNNAKNRCLCQSCWMPEEEACQP